METLTGLLKVTSYFKKLLSTQVVTTLFKGECLNSMLLKFSAIMTTE